MNILLSTNCPVQAGRLGLGLGTWSAGLQRALHFLFFTLAFWAIAFHFAQAAEPIDKPFAQVWRIEGEVAADGTNGRHLLRLGDTVLVGERLTASATAEAVLKTQDAGFIAIRPGAEFVALQFSAQGTATDSTHIQVLKGALRIISGWIGKLNRKGSVLTTPTATIGIRGTDHEPYVLLAEDEDSLRFKPGTYDKVNQGGTTLEAAGQSVNIDPGRVGFARAAGKSRALLTLLFPVLLEKVPDFYVPGKFDVEMDALAQSAESNNQQQLLAKRKQNAACVPSEIAKRWTHELDQNIVRGDAAAILSMFGPDVRVKATVRGANGKMTEIELEGAELADSIVTAVATLSNYKHRRITLEGKPSESGASACGPVAVKSIVIEEGRQAGKPYRFESEEKYLLEQMEGIWRATAAQTRQRW
jgi:hypothetical protein